MSLNYRQRSRSSGSDRKFRALKGRPCLVWLSLATLGLLKGIFQLWKIGHRGVSALLRGIPELQAGERGGKSGEMGEAGEATSLQIRGFASWDEKGKEGPLPVAGCVFLEMELGFINIHFL